MMLWPTSLALRTMCKTSSYLRLIKANLNLKLTKKNNNEGTFFLEGQNFKKTFQIYFFHHNVMLS